MGTWLVLGHVVLKSVLGLDLTCFALFMLMTECLLAAVRRLLAKEWKDEGVLLLSGLSDGIKQLLFTIASSSTSEKVDV